MKFKSNLLKVNPYLLIYIFFLNMMSFFFNLGKVLIFSYEHTIIYWK